jgi:MFS family permease
MAEVAFPPLERSTPRQPVLQKTKILGRPKMTTQTQDKIPCGRWWRIIPPTILVYIFSFMDRTNIGFAMAGGMNESLSMSASFSGLAAGIFFVGYILLQVPGGHIAEHGSAKKFIGFSILIWGGLSVACGFVETANQLLAVRFLIGVAEGGVWPATLVILSHWFPNEERGRANAYFLMNIAVASIITAPVSGWIIGNFGWRWVFIGEGAVSLLLIFVWWPLMSDRPEKAKWISEEEKNYLVAKIREEQSAIKTTNAKVSYKDLFADWKLWRLVAIYFFYQIGIYGFSMWLPTLIKTLTNSGMTSVGILSMFPYVAMIGGLYLFAQLSDRTMNRRRYTAMPMILFAASFLLSTLCKEQIWVSYAFLVLCGVFMQSASSIFWTIPPLTFPAEVAGGARGIINALGNLGGFFGPFVVGWFRTSFDSYDAGVYFLVTALVAGFLLTLTLPASTTGKAQNSEGVGEAASA